jgi:hypothetical protein
MKLLGELQERAKTMEPRVLENAEYGTLECEEESLTIITKKERLKIEWADIDEVHAFKRDISTVDLICLAFKRRDRDEYLEVHEEMSGYRDMLKVLPEHLPGYSDAWFSEVAFPAFATNHRVVWKSRSEPNEASRPANATGGA